MKELEIRACILAIAHCYYLRISNNREREELLKLISESQGKVRKITPNRILEIINLE